MLNSIQHPPAFVREGRSWTPDQVRGDERWSDGYIASMTLAGHPRISVDAAICGGRPTIAGTRVRVSDILEMLAGGATEAEIVADYPYISTQDVRAALAYAAGVHDHPVVTADAAE